MTSLPVPRDSHPYHMHDAILAQPDAIARMLNEEQRSVERMARLVGESERIHLVGIGTSWHAALVGEYMMHTIASREDVRAWNSFEFVTAPPSLDRSDAVIVLSHRGTKTYSADSLDLARAHGARTAVITGVGSAIDPAMAHAVIQTSVSDPSSAFTISHTGAMTALAMLTATLASNRRRFRDELQRLPGLVTEALTQEPAVRDWAAATRGVERHYFTGWGPNASTAYEAALKMKEANYTTTEGFHLEQYLHGPFVSTDDGCQVTFVVPPIVVPPMSGANRAIDVMNAANAVGARTAAIVQAGDQERVSAADTVIEAPAVSEALSPIPYLVPLQLYTYWLAVELGHNPDVFRLNDPRHLSARDHYQL
ncbi:MAG TPA: SIS domain-containing protein [SAR202 cluster bacterium]|nr:SIS domain-containing protein [SAR202 cluster bacterium]